MQDNQCFQTLARQSVLSHPGRQVGDAERDAQKRVKQPQQSGLENPALWLFCIAFLAITSDSHKGTICLQLSRNLSIPEMFHHKSATLQKQTNPKNPRCAFIRMPYGNCTKKAPPWTGSMHNFPQAYSPTTSSYPTTPSPHSRQTHKITPPLTRSKAHTHPRHDMTPP